MDVLAPLASLGATAHKIGTDIRLLANLKVRGHIGSHVIHVHADRETLGRKLKSHSSQHRSVPAPWLISAIQ